MTEKHKVRFEPVGIEIDVDENQTILRAAAEQGIMLMHGCKEGQCAACKSFILEGEDIEHDKYSTFALPDYEKEEGYTLLCRAHAYEDVTIELLNYDEDMIRSGLPIQQADRRGGVQGPGDARHAPPGAAADRAGRGQVLPRPVHGHRVPGTDQVRSFSMANTSSRDGLLEFVIKVYPDGLFSQFLDQRTRRSGDRLELTGPFGVFTLRESDAELVFVGGGAGMAPILSLLRSMAERGIHRKATFFYGARGQRDLCFEDELRAIAEKLPNFTYIPALSDEDWDGENGLITDVVKRLTGSLAGAHAYVCGPPPMVEAAIPLLETLGVPDKRVYYDKFTTTGEPT